MEEMVEGLEVGRKENNDLKDSRRKRGRRRIRRRRSSVDDEWRER